MLSRSLDLEYVCSLVLKMTGRNRTLQNGRVSTHSDVQCGSASRQTSFSRRSNARIKLPFSGHISNKFRRPTIFQLNVEGLIASKINVLHHLAMQSKALVILLQETYYTDAEKLVHPNYKLTGSSLSRKHGLATFVHERLRYTLLDQSSPKSEIEWLCVNVDGYKIVNVYKPPPKRLRNMDLLVFPHPCLYTGDFNCRHAHWGYDDNLNCKELILIQLFTVQSYIFFGTFENAIYETNWFVYHLKKSLKKSFAMTINMECPLIAPKAE